MVKHGTFTRGAALLGGVGLLCSALGSVYRILLASSISADGMAYYQIAYPIYSLLTVIATAGLPTAISKRVSECVAQGDYRNAQYFFQVAFGLLATVGCVAMVAVAALAGPIAVAQGIPGGRLPVLAIAPSLLLISLVSAYRGYFQGLQRMQPTAVSQVVEEVVKFAVGYALAVLWMQRGSMWAAVGALIGIPVSELCALLYMAIRYNRERPQLRGLIRQSPRVQRYAPRRAMRRELWRLALPITIGASVLPLITLLDNVMVINVLKSIGFSQQIAQTRFGLLTGMVSPVVYVPMAVASALQMSLVPTISASAVLQRPHEVEQNAAVGIKLSVLLALPCAAGLWMLGPPLLQTLFPSALMEADNLLAATGLIRAMSIGLMFLIVAQTATGILQGIGFADVPVKNLCKGAVVKVVVSYICLRMPGVNVVGAGVGTACCFAFAALANLRRCYRIIGMRVELKRTLVRPALATGVMSGTVYGVYVLVRNAWTVGGGVLLATLVGIAVYTLCMLRFGVIGSEECRLLPGGIKLEYWMHRIGWWK